MSLLELGARARAAMLPTYPVMLGAAGTGGARTLVSQRIGFPYIINRVTLIVGETPDASNTMQIYIGDDPTPETEFANFASIFTTRGDNLIAGRPFPRLLYKTPVTFSPRKRIERAPTFIKMFWLNTTAGKEYWTLLDLIPLP